MKTVDAMIAVGASIFVVDDTACLTDLYTIVLESAGYMVRTFNDRAEALYVLRSEREKPDLLITDYLGGTIDVDLFLRQCLKAHPGLRILMASGYRPSDAEISKTN